MNLADVMDDIATRIDTISGLRVHAYPADSVAPPAAIVTYPDEYPFDATFGRGMDRITLPVVVLVGKASDRASRDTIGPYVDGSGASSLKAVIEGDGASFLDLPGGGVGSASTSNRATFNTGANAIWLAADVALDDWTPAAINTLLSRYSTLFNLKGWLFDITTLGEPRATISSTGANDFIATGGALGFTDATRHGVAVRIVPNDGAGNRTFQFYTAPTLAGPWVTHGALITQAGAVSIFNTTVAVSIGVGDGGTTNPAAGNVFGVEFRSGDQTGTVLAAADTTNLEPGVHGFMDDVTDWPWTLGGNAAIVAGSGFAPYTAFDSVRVTGADFDIVRIANVDYLAATFTLDIAGTGA